MKKIYTFLACMFWSIITFAQDEYGQYDPGISQMDRDNHELTKSVIESNNVTNIFMMAFVLLIVLSILNKYRKK